MAGLIDPTVAGKYPVILGDGLLGKTSNDIFTGIRCATPLLPSSPNKRQPCLVRANTHVSRPDNHKPALSSDDAPSSARLKPSVPGKTDSYDLSFTDDDGAYAYAGSRNTTGSQYVLHFDAERKAFILDRIDSTFNMNVTRLPGNSDSARLSRQYPHLENKRGPETQPKRGAAKKTPAPKVSSSATSAAKPQPKEPKEPKRKPEKKQQAKEAALSFPEPEKEKPKPKRNSFDEEEDEDEDDDGGLLIEYPGADTAAAARQTDFSPAFPPLRPFDDFMNQRDSDADDADGESDDEPDMDFKLPSPVNHHRQGPGPEPTDEDAREEEHDEGDVDVAHDLEGDLEKEMEEAFEGLANSQEDTPVAGDESEISEED
ncbi:Transcription elognation factor Eaf [Metarhizium album ARSEF 1941]|uniref:Transcription elognation factor Eaf n=1 Tax=Metarhizium album (strain ARSEF 1941) TaxID=1081103 RepID=A0A0B2WRT8_METAS|nr:Transcription elognation factor Eaf [Metarhizium album ARSEF 1941]KHN98751.1 Transcription elognation factor Eaf [Metarhizium album ARSEF 1941]